MSAYANQLREWISYLQADHGLQVPQDFLNAPVSDQALYSMAMNIYNFARTSRHQPPSSRQAPKEGANRRMYYLIPFREADGSVYYVDLYDNNQIAMSMTKQPNGLFAYRGPREMMTILGGRGELGDMLRRVEDDDFFHDRKKAA